MNGGKSILGGTAGLYMGAAILRLALFTLFPGLPDLLTGRVEISTPVTSFKRCTLFFDPPLWFFPSRILMPTHSCGFFTDKIFCSTRRIVSL